MRTRRHHSIIRAILFIVRLQKATHPFRQTSKRAARNPYHKAAGSSKLKRCESTRNRLPAVRSKHSAKHRNSAPTTLLFRTPTPLVEVKYFEEQCNFGSFARMMQPYTLRLERSNSGGGSGVAASTSKTQINIHTSMAHQLASRLLLQKQPSLDDRRTIGAANSDPSSELGKLIHRQGSVESGGDKKKSSTSSTTAQNGQEKLERKIKNSMINLFGALTAIEQNDLDSLKVILSKNCFALNDTLESGLYGHFSTKLTLLDAALMLGRRQAAELLLNHGAAENPELSDINHRRKIVDEVIMDNQSRLKLFIDKLDTKDNEKRVRFLKAQLATLNKMKSILANSIIPGPPTDAKVHVTSPTRATIEFTPPHQHCYPSTSLAIDYNCVVTKYRVEWSKTDSFETLSGSIDLTDMRKTKINVDNMERGQCYTFRIKAASMWGFGKFTLVYPKAIRISSWDDIDNLPNYRIEQMKKIAELYENVERYRQSTVWQRVFPNCDIMNVKKKKTGLRFLFSASSKFTKNIQRGVYLASIIYTEGKVLCTVDDCLPVLCVDEQISTVSTDDMNWLMKLSLCWDQVAYLQESMNGCSCSSSSQFRAKILDAVTSMHNALGVRDIGRIHHVPMSCSNGAVFLVSVHLVNESQTVQGLAMRWMKMEKLVRKKLPCSALDFLCKELFNILNFFESSQIPLDPGLYISYLCLQSSLNVIRVTVPENLPSVLPFALVRSNPHVSEEEWEWLRLIDQKPFPSKASPLQVAFHQQLGKAAAVLINDLDMEIDLIQKHRLYRLQVLQLHSDVSFILIIPKAEDVCSVSCPTSENGVNEQFRGCTSIPIPVFQMINLFTYQPDFIAAYCRLSIFLEHFIMVLQYEQRQCLLENDSKVYADQLEKLSDFQQQLDEIWKSSRWISNIASVARDREQQNICSLLLTSILEPLSPSFFLMSDEVTDVGYHSDNSVTTARKDFHKFSRMNGIVALNGSSNVPLRSNPLQKSKLEPEPSSLADCQLNRSRRHSEKFLRKASKVEQSKSAFKEANLQNIDSSCPLLQYGQPLQPAPTVNYDSAPDLNNVNQPAKSYVIRVFVAYECGLESGASVRLKITNETTAKEIAALVVEQIAKITTSSLDICGQQEGVETSQDCQDFCLVAVVGARERRLRDSFPLLNLQAPWSKGKLFVRHVNCISSAIQFGNEALV